MGSLKVLKFLKARVKVMYDLAKNVPDGSLNTSKQGAHLNFNTFSRLISYEDPIYKCNCNGCRTEGIVRLWRTFKNDNRIILGCTDCIARIYNNGVYIRVGQTRKPPYDSRLAGRIFMPAIINRANGGFYPPDFEYLKSTELNEWQKLPIIGSPRMI